MDNEDFNFFILFTSTLIIYYKIILNLNYPYKINFKGYSNLYKLTYLL